jgi:hypothetical protein
MERERGGGGGQKIHQWENQVGSKNFHLTSFALYIKKEEEEEEEGEAFF